MLPIPVRRWLQVPTKHTSTLIICPQFPKLETWVPIVWKLPDRLRRWSGNLGFFPINQACFYIILGRAMKNSLSQNLLYVESNLSSLCIDQNLHDYICKLGDGKMEGFPLFQFSRGKIFSFNQGWYKKYLTAIRARPPTIRNDIRHWVHTGLRRKQGWLACVGT